MLHLHLYYLDFLCSLKAANIPFMFGIFALDN